MRTPQPTILDQDALLSIAVALLAVQNYSVERAWNLHQKMAENALLDAAAVAALSLDQVTTRLIAAGYDRGHLTVVMARRFKCLMEAAMKGDLDGISHAVTSKDRESAIALLQKIEGIGPLVARNAWLLLQHT